MTPDDPRHGSQRGRSQHYRDGEPACEPCKAGDQIAARRRRKRKQLGHVYALPVGPKLHAHLLALRADGATYHQIAQWAGISYRAVYDATNGGPTARVYPHTHAALMAAQPPLRVTTHVGLTRRIRALQALGYSLRYLSSETGVSENWLAQIRDGHITGTPKRRAKASIVAVYEHLEMRLPVGGSIGVRRGRTRALNLAATNGWPTPMAWDNDTIDDPNEQPTGVGHRRRYLNDITIANEYDEAVVTRILGGDFRVPATYAERCAVVARWPGSHNELERRTSWKIERYIDRESA